MALERTYIIPLRKEWLKVPIYKRSKKAITATKQFLQKHMKTEDVRLGKYLNQAIWARGMKKPPHKLEVMAKKIEEKEGNYVFAELTSAPKAEEKKEEAATKTDKLGKKLKEALKAPEDKAAEEKHSEEEKLLKKTEEQKAKVMKKPHVEKTAERKSQKENIVPHSGKAKVGVETTGRH